MRSLVSLLAVLALGCGPLSPYQTKLRAKYPSDRTPHVEAAGVVLGGKVWLISGTPGSSSNGCNCEADATTDVDIYDPATDSWSSGPKVNAARSEYPNAYLVGDTVYLVGGVGPNVERRGVEKLAPPYTAWEAIPNSNSPGYAGFTRAAGVIDGKIVSVLPDGDTATAYVFDPVTAAWSTKASRPNGASFTAGAVIGGKLYMLGGLDAAAKESREIVAYDLASDTFSTAGTLPAPVQRPTSSIYEHFAVVLGGEIVTTGGDTAGTTIATFDPTTGKAARYEDGLTIARSDHVAAVVNDHLYLLGGIEPSTSEALVPTIEIWK